MNLRATAHLWRNLITIKTKKKKGGLMIIIIE